MLTFDPHPVRLLRPEAAPPPLTWTDRKAALLAELGAKRFMEEPDYFIAWGSSQQGAGLGITYPFNKEKATAGNGTMVALSVASPDEAKKMHAKALSLGGKDEGAPGFRPAEANSGFYGAYFRDLDGNKFVAFCMVPKK